ncbi:ly6/PLAUR domain-containing protein 1-like [Octopus sinensis]|uniref:Ly6/PLAUR domain-containing protein 1-like n=1 Tax=Octopus sinensis TaxID=2607531 RepID=A0A7E6F236_9MOLL|nr:ly6/PLAUR domain-containing protein 1-like [Octopus sinensis]
MMCGCHLPALVNYTKSKFSRTVHVLGECQTDPGNNQSKIIPIMKYTQCQNYSLFQRNLQCQTCSGFTGKESEVTNCIGDEPVCENKITMNGVTLEFEKSCSTYRKCLAAQRNNTFTCNKWTSGASCVSCCTGNLCNRNYSIGKRCLFSYIR